MTTALLVLTAERQGAPSESARFGAAADEQIDLTQASEGERRPGEEPHRGVPFHRLFEQWYSIGDTPDQGIRKPQGRSAWRKQQRDVCGLAERQAPFEQWDGLVQVAFAYIQATDPHTGVDAAV